MEITLEQAKAYLATLGVQMPDFLLQLLVDRVNTVSACLTDHGVDPSTAMLIELYLIGLYGVVQGDKLVTSQTAPSGASQSYKYGSLQDRYRAQLSLLRELDVYGCATSLIPAEPGPKAGLWLGRGGCDCV